MDNKDRINLKKMMKEYDVVDQTQNIRNLKHSSLIKEDVSIIKDLYKQFPNKSKDFLETKYFEKSNFLFKNYTEIYNKLIKNDIPIVPRIIKDQVCIDLRSVFDNQDAVIVQALNNT